MLRAFDLLQQGADLVQRQPRPQTTQIMRFDLKSLGSLCRPLFRQTGAQDFIDQHLEWPAAAACFRREAGSHIIIDGQGSTHIMML